MILTPGCPFGIGPEVALRALQALEGEDSAPEVLLVGDGEALHRAASELGLRLVRATEPGPGLRWSPPAGADPEPVEIRALRQAVTWIGEGRAQALVTGPIHKGRLAARGFHHLGHTEFLGELTGVPDPVMAFVGGELRVALVTVHLPLRAVPQALSPARIQRVVRLAALALRDQLGLSRPRLAVCGLNPHAGDGGALGEEEIHLIAPALAELGEIDAEVQGPISAEAAFWLARRGEVDLVVAMYHDQGLAPLKAVDFGRSVNWTLGLPLIRTSVDHGTADALVGTGRAESGSMEAALRFAARLVQGRRG